MHWDSSRTARIWVERNSLWLENTAAGIAASMNTAPAREMAQKRMRFVELFLGQLVAEQDGRR
jgi:HD superfamily phosphodiesterase